MGNEILFDRPSDTRVKIEQNRHFDIYFMAGKRETGLWDFFHSSLFPWARAINAGRQKVLKERSAREL
jgi:hypothetical protein